MSSGTSSTTGPGRPTRRDGEGAAHELGDALNRLDSDQLLRGGTQDLHLPRLLGHVLPGVVPVAVAGDEHQRGAGVQRLDHAGEQVGGAGAERRVAHAHPAAHLGPGVGGEHAAAFVVHQIVVDSKPARGVVERQELESAHAEHGADLVCRSACAPALRRRSSPSSRPFPNSPCARVQYSGLLFRGIEYARTRPDCVARAR